MHMPDYKITRDITRLFVAYATPENPYHMVT